MADKNPRDTKDFSTLDDYLDEEGMRAALEAVVMKEVLAWRIEEAMNAQGLSRKRAARVGDVAKSLTYLAQVTAT
jgi:hypothetical protein